MKKKRLIQLVGAAAVLGLLYTAFVPKAVQVDAAPVTRGTFRETVKADGLLRSKDRFIVPAFADGDIRRVDLKAGDPIRKGAAITQLFWDVRWEPVKSPITGVISKVFRESAGPIRRGEPIVEVIDPTKLEIMAEVLTTDATRITPGDPVAVEGWGDQGAFHARVNRVSKAGFTKQSALGVEEEKTEVVMEPIDLPRELLSRVGSTFHVDVSIQVAQVNDALKVPTGAVFRDGDDWAVYRISNGHARVTKVNVAARGNQEVMVASGITEGDRVILFPGDLVKDGVRVRSRAG